MQVIIEAEEIASVIRQGAATFDDGRLRGRCREEVWLLVTAVGLTMPATAEAADGVPLVHCRDDQGRDWYAFRTDDGGRGLFLTPKDPNVVSGRLALHGADLTVPFRPVVAHVCAGDPDPNDDYRDPMDEPGAGVCGDCGAYPLSPDEWHECAGA